MVQPHGTQQLAALSSQALGLRDGDSSSPAAVSSHVTSISTYTSVSSGAQTLGTSSTSDAAGTTTTNATTSLDPAVGARTGAGARAQHSVPEEPQDPLPSVVAMDGVE
jgi:hypothetical protein